VHRLSLTQPAPTAPRIGWRRRLTVLAAALAFAAVSRSAGDVPIAAKPRSIAPGVWLIAGGLWPDRQPDGNSVVFESPCGVVVIDTGRHEWHRAAILKLARDHGRDVVAIVNTHWHLDHVSGNPTLRRAYPQLRVHASNAIDAALAGFLAQSSRESVAYLEDETIPATMREDIAADAVTVQNGAALRPDVVIDRSGPQEVGGRVFEVHLAHDAVTAGDVWLYEPRTKIAVLGDLVTLPAPFLDTACPQGWLNALREVERTDFMTAIPGHGEPMTRAQVAVYRSSLAAFIDCAASTQPAAACSAQWLAAVEPLLSAATGEAARMQAVTNYYVDLLRANGGSSAHCTARATPRA
jgi:glyoxylase-like metal-dependent hydrolase (beta-lactamase superfamily II)